MPWLALVYGLWHLSRVYLPPPRRYLALVLRLLDVTLLIGGLSHPSAGVNANDLAVAILLDRSASTTPAERAQEEQVVSDALAHKAPSDQIALIGFGGEASLRVAPRQRWRHRPVPGQPGASRPVLRQSPDVGLFHGGGDRSDLVGARL